MPGDARAVLMEQERHQAELDRKRQVWWLPWLMVIGLALSGLGLFISIENWREGTAPGIKDYFFAFCAFQFGLAIVFWLALPLRQRPRVVPYFSREIEPYGGKSAAAFQRGHAIFREITGLDRLAGKLGLTPLSAFGFADDYYEQEVRWHAAADGLRSVDALRSDDYVMGRPELSANLDALATALRAAAENDVQFALVLRRFTKDNLQGVSTRETRQGRFW